MVQLHAVSWIIGASAIGEDVTLLQSVSHIGNQLKSGADAGIGAAQLDATNRMVDTIVSFAQDPDVMARVPEGVIEAFAEQSQAIQAAIVAQNAEDQTSITDAVSAVSVCNDNMESSFTASGGINYLNVGVDGARQDHAACRVLEDDAVTMWQSLCDTAQDKSNSFYAAEPDCLGSTEAYIDKGEYLSCTTATGVWYGEHYSGFQAAVTKCDNQEILKDSYHGWCDTNQSHFEMAYVEYATKLSDTCTAFHACYTQNLEAHDTLKAEVEAKEVSQKELFKAVSKLNCLISTFETATGENLIAGAVESCLSADVDASSLAITYPDVEAPELCDATTATWNSTEYANLNASHIEPIDSVVPIIATTTAASTAAAFSLPFGKTVEELTALGFVLQCRSECVTDTPEDDIEKLCLPNGDITFPAMEKSGTFSLRVCSRYCDGESDRANNIMPSGCGGSEMFVHLNDEQYSAVWSLENIHGVVTTGLTSHDYRVSTKCSDNQEWWGEQGMYYADFSFNAGDVITVQGGYGNGCISKAEWDFL